MRASLIASTPQVLEDLRRGVQAEGHEVVHAGLREPGLLDASLRRAEGELLIVQGSCQPEDLAAIERYTGEHPSRLVLLMCARRDSEGLIAAMRAGVQEVIHSPLDGAELAASLRRAARRRPPAPARGGRGTIVAFIATKGGSGSTFLATNFAHMVATEGKKKTAFIDLDLEYGDASSFLTDQRAKATVADVARQVERLDAKLLASSMLPITPQLALLPAPDDPEAGFVVTGQEIERVLDLAREVYEVVVLDLGRIFDGVAIKALDKADVICPVTEDLMPFIRDAKRLAKSFRSLGYPDSKVHLVVNRYDKRSTIPLADLEKAVGLKVGTTIPNSFEAIAEAINLGVPLVQVAPRNPVVAALRSLASRLVDTPRRPAGFLGRLVSHER